MTAQQYVLITNNGVRIDAYGPDPNPQKLQEAGHLLADGASPAITIEVIPLQPAEWDEI